MTAIVNYKAWHTSSRDLIGAIERQTSRAVVIEGTETIASLSKCHAQDQSPLFARLPREIRDLVWEYATAPYEDEENRYDENQYYYRPGHTARSRTDTNLLLTCRRIWLEANGLPMLQAEHCYWYYRGAPDGKTGSSMARLSNLNRRNFGRLHLFAQMYAIERLTSNVGRLRNYFIQTPPKQGDFQPRVLHVTIRHTDWWWWEHDEPLRFKDSWLHALLKSPDLRSTQILKLELETLDYKVKQLETIVSRLETIESEEFETHLVNDHAVTTKFVRDATREVTKWSGPVDIDDQHFTPYNDMSRLNYHVITLTWRLTFPQMPNAHMPTMRLSPRLPETLPRGTQVQKREDEDDGVHVMRNLRERPYQDQIAWPRRRRGRKSRKAEKRRAHDSAQLELLDAELNVRTESMVQDLWCRMFQRKLYKQRMATAHTSDWEERWQREDSLLKFE